MSEHGLVARDLARSHGDAALPAGWKRRLGFDPSAPGCPSIPSGPDGPADLALLPDHSAATVCSADSSTRKAGWSTAPGRRSKSCLNGFGA
jgi:hypothetical protein